MTAVALAVIAVWIVVVVAARGYVHAGRTGDPGVRYQDRRGSPQWWARAVGLVAFVLLVLAPVSELAGLDLPSVTVPRRTQLIGLGVAIVGIVGTLVSQTAMGVSWRADVDPDARTTLVTTGPFRFVRNPIFTMTMLTLAGIVLMVPNVLALTMLVATIVSQQIQVRLVEEPYLRRVHGDAYRAYAERTGRFLPWIGRDRPTSRRGNRVA